MNTPHLTHVDNSIDIVGPSRIATRTRELAIQHFRVPFVWAQLQAADSHGRLVWKEKALAGISAFLDTLPSDARVLGVFTNPPAEVAARYFDEPASISEPFERFVGECVGRFSSIESWEIWNEPNASDFYLSVRDDLGTGHRPWTAQEYVDHVLVPGAQAARRANRQAGICVAGLAENGMVGHAEKVPCITNRLRGTTVFEKFRSKQLHGQLYFIPRFLRALIDAFRRQAILPGLEHPDSLWDAVAFHPYPYLGVHKKVRPNLLNETLGLIREFIDEVSPSLAQGKEIWVTEVGCRSLDVPNRNHWDEERQADYARSLLVDPMVTNHISRLYWYHLIDSDFDLRQEKTFGALDQNGAPKKVFFELQSIALRESTTRPDLFDDFTFGTKFASSGANPNIWTVDSNTPFSFAIATELPDGTRELTLGPGRSVNDWIRLESKLPVSLGSPRRIDIGIGVRVRLRDDNFVLRISAARDAGGLPTCRVDIRLAPPISIRVETHAGAEERTIKTDHYPFAVLDNVTAVQVGMEERGISVALHLGELVLASAFGETGLSADIEAAFVRIELLQLRNRPGFASLANVKIRGGSSLPTGHGYPLDHPQIADGDWTFVCPPASQIHQDEWVIQAARFRRGGFFVEIGGHDGVANSNTVMLERHFGWSGLVVEANPRWFSKVCENRKCVPVNCAVSAQEGLELDFVDAGAVGALVSHLQSDIHADLRKKRIAEGGIIKVRAERGDTVLERHRAPDLIDYVSIDTEGSELEVVRSIDFSRWRICLMTIEHGGNQDKRESIYQLLSKFGFQRERVWFEDWYFHIGHLAQLLGSTATEAREHMERVNALIRYNRRTEVIRQALAARKIGNRDLAMSRFLEATRPFYPDRPHPLSESVVELTHAGRFAEAQLILREALALAPNHPAVLRSAVSLFAAVRDYISLVAHLEKLLGSKLPAAQQSEMLGQLMPVRKEILDAIERGRIPSCPRVLRCLGAG